MNRRNLLKSLVAIPLIGIPSLEAPAMAETAVLSVESIALKLSPEARRMFYANLWQQGTFSADELRALETVASVIEEHVQGKTISLDELLRRLDHDD